MSLFHLFGILIAATGVLAWVNARFLRLPANIGMLAMGLVASMLLLSVEVLFPGQNIYKGLVGTIRQIDFYDALMNGMLAYLLFAGALHVNLGRLKSRAVMVGLLATAGVVMSALIVGYGLWGVATLVGAPLSLAWALVFGALIAPTDPVAVLSTLKAVSMPKSLQTDVTGEALFNDGIAIVVFTIMLENATANGAEAGLLAAVSSVGLEAGGAVLFGLATGYLVFFALRGVDDYSTEVILTIALVTVTYAGADEIGISGPIAVVVAGLIIGNRGAAHAMSDTTRKYVFGFWTLTDDILNAVLFLLIGLEVLVLPFDALHLWIAVAAIPIVLAGRFVAVGISIAILQRWLQFVAGALVVLTWAGVRGGISVALALALPDSEAKSMILVSTYAIVLFTVLVQGLTLGWVVRRSGVQAGAGQGA